MNGKILLHIYFWSLSFSTCHSITHPFHCSLGIIEHQITKMFHSTSKLKYVFLIISIANAIQSTISTEQTMNAFNYWNVTVARQKASNTIDSTESNYSICILFINSFPTSANPFYRALSIHSTINGDQSYGRYDENFPFNYCISCTIFNSCLNAIICTTYSLLWE